MVEQHDLTPEEWREAASSPAPYVATRLGPVNTMFARIFVAMEEPPAAIRFTDPANDWAIIQEEGHDVYRLGAGLPEPDGAVMWRVDAQRDVTASAADLRVLAQLILDTLDGKVQGVRFPPLGTSREGGPA